MKRVAFVLGTPNPEVARRGEWLNESDMELLTKIADNANLDATMVFSIIAPKLVGKPKNVKIKDIRTERERVLAEIHDCDPSFVMCFGPLAISSVFNRGNVPMAELRRKENFMPDVGAGALPIWATYSLEAVAAKQGLAKWLGMDLKAAAYGYVETQWGQYTYLLPGKPGWRKCPAEFRDLPAGTMIGFDLETYPGLDPWHPQARIRMAIFSIEVGKATVVVSTPAGELPEWVIHLLTDPKLVKAGSNIAYDYRWMRRFGTQIRTMWDTSTAEHLLDENQPEKGLKSLTFLYRPELGDYSRGQRDLVDARGGWEHVTDTEMLQYAGGDGEASLAAALGQRDKITARGLDRPRKLIRDVYDVLAEMQCDGAAIDLDINAKMDVAYTAHLAKLRSAICEALGPVNPNSPTQLANALIQEIKDINLRPPQIRRVLGVREDDEDDEDEDISTAKAVLEREAFRHPVIGSVLEYRRWAKMHGTYVKGLREKHVTTRHGIAYVHPSYRTDVTHTYRLSSQRPNGQNIPRKPRPDEDPMLNVKQQFISRFPGGEILEGDESQLEIRVAAHESQDPRMIEAILTEDTHRAMSAIMLGKPADQITEPERQRCKSLTFLILYGGGARRLSAALGVSKPKAQRLIDDYFEAFPTLHDRIMSAHAQVRRALQLESAFGFRRRFYRPPNWDCYEAFRIQRQAWNFLIQNPAACITYAAMISLSRAFEEHNVQSRLVLQVHDSMVIDVFPGERDKVAALVTESMEHPPLAEYGVNFSVPLHCDIKVGPTWGTAVPLKEAS